MTAQPDRLTIVHATDLKPGGGVAFAHALALARDARARLVTVNASNDGQPERPMPEAATVLAQWGSDVLVEHSAIRHTCCDDPVDTLLDFLRRQTVDLLVLATHQVGGVRRLLHDSVSESVARNANLPTLFVPFSGRGFTDAATGAITLKTVIVPTKAAADAWPALTMLGRLADAAGWASVEVVVLYVGTEAPTDLSTLPGHPRLHLRAERRSGSLIPALVSACDEYGAHLVAMSTRGHDGVLDVLLGSNTERALHAVPCPLLAIPDGSVQD
jgi:nucleotide-binding universal stress UspA family protein